MSDTASRIAALLRNIPRPASDDDSRAAWFEEKAATFQAIADSDPSLADEAAQAAANARAEARRLRRRSRS
jgi:hypothetical protein